MTERIVLAHSGELDTSVAIGWLSQETGAEVIAGGPPSMRSSRRRSRPSPGTSG